MRRRIASQVGIAGCAQLDARTRMSADQPPYVYYSAAARSCSTRCARSCTPCRRLSTHADQAQQRAGASRRRCAATVTRAGARSWSALEAAVADAARPADELRATRRRAEGPIDWGCSTFRACTPASCRPVLAGAEPPSRIWHERDAGFAGRSHLRDSAVDRGPMVHFEARRRSQRGRELRRMW